MSARCVLCVTQLYSTLRLESVHNLIINILFETKSLFTTIHNCLTLIQMTQLSVMAQKTQL